jgi:hypothetical protein
MSQTHMDRFLRLAGFSAEEAAARAEVPPAEALTEAARRLAGDSLTTAAAVMERGLSLLVGVPELGAVDPGWLRRFVRLAGDVSTAEQSAFWSRVFGLELVYPDTISGAALEMLARCDDADLQLIRRIAPLVLNDFIVLASPSLLEEKGLTQDGAGQLEELGLLRPDAGYSKTFESQHEDRFSTVLLYRDTAVRVEHDQAARKLVLKVRRLSKAGAQLCAAVSGGADFEQLMELTRLLRRRGYTVNHSALINRAPLRNVARHSGFVEIVPFPKRGRTPEGQNPSS